MSLRLHPVGRAALVAGLAGLALTACTRTVVKTVVVTVTVTPSLPSVPSPTPSPFTATPASGVLAMGQTGTTALGNRVTVYSWDTNVHWPVAPRVGSMLSRVDVKFCAADPLPPGGRIPVGELPLNLNLQLADATLISGESTGYNSDELLTSQASLGAGDCARGFVIFQSPKGKHPALVIYSSSSEIMWRVP
jgi:hypothetical protein